MKINDLPLTPQYCPYGSAFSFVKSLNVKTAGVNSALCGHGGELRCVAELLVIKDNCHTFMAWHSLFFYFFLSLFYFDSFPDEENDVILLEGIVIQFYSSAIKCHLYCNKPIGGTTVQVYVRPAACLQAATPQSRQ